MLFLMSGNDGSTAYSLFSGGAEIDKASLNLATIGGKLEMAEGESLSGEDERGGDIVREL